MKGLKKKRRIQIIVVAAVALTVSTAMIGYAMRNGINYFRTPTQVMSEQIAPDEVFRIGGLVEKGSVTHGAGEEVSFKVTDTKSSVPVTYTGVLPDLFSEGTGVVALGSFDHGTFHATQILAKHDANYMPKEVIDALKKQGVYVAPSSS
ncbi:MAG: cytochrome c maturation protein CcmE [Paracoccaceae bacterium]|nr:cytochrome c maturation protein CcmE [Paracoccaceae bacterium]MDE3238963.1 cytochrome c maturation protein CcmE [Paracoccaceae bacterium]